MVQDCPEMVRTEMVPKWFKDQIQRWFRNVLNTVCFKESSKVVHKRFKNVLKVVLWYSELFRDGTVQKWQRRGLITQWFKNTNRQIVHRSFRDGSESY
jgi:hypothetical protein